MLSNHFKFSMYISIIIPIFNSEKYIKRCINSWKNQTNKSFELIFVDDGSIDSSIDILNNFCEKESDFNITVLSKEHAGVSTARNEGLKVASGDIIGFCDIDDVVNKYIVEYVLLCFERTNSDIVCTYKKDIVKKQIEQFQINRMNYSDEKNISVERFKWQICFDVNIFGSVWNKFIKSKVINGICFDKNLSMCEDTHFIYNIINENSNLKISEITLPLYGYVNNIASVTNDKSKLFDENGNLKYCNALIKIKQMSISETEKHWINAKEFELIIGSIINKQYLSEENKRNLLKNARRYIYDYIIWGGFSIAHKIKNVSYFIVYLFK